MKFDKDHILLDDTINVGWHLDETHQELRAIYSGLVDRFDDNGFYIKGIATYSDGTRFAGDGYHYFSWNNPNCILLFRFSDMTDAIDELGDI